MRQTRANRIKNIKANPMLTESAQRRDFIIYISIFFIITFFYFLLIGESVLKYQEEQFLFRFSTEYLNGFLTMPGGLLEYTGKFLMQFYAVPLYGALLLAIAVISPGILMNKFLRNTNSNPGLSLVLPIIVTSLLLILQNQYSHVMYYDLGIICVISWFLFTLKFSRYYLHIILFPVFYYFTGAFAILFVIAYLIYTLAFIKGRQKIYSSAFIIIVSLLTFLVFKSVLFLVSSKTLLTYPLPAITQSFQKLFFIILSVFVALFPVLGMSSVLKKTRILFIRLIAVSFIIFSALLLTGTYNPSLASILKIQECAYKDDWNKVIELSEKSHQENLISQYFYNTALAEKGSLCEKLFTTGQSFGTKALILPWGDQNLERGAYFFYATGLVNEAHRWAYEEMVVYGLRPHNLIMLIKTSLLNSDYRMAEKYINILRKTLFYRKDAIRYENLLNNKDLISKDNELGKVAQIIPQKDFIIYMDSPEDNLPMLLESNPDNRVAFEYMISWLLLEKDVETALSNLHLMKSMGYTSLPRSVEEAVMIYYNSQHKLPDMNGYSVSSETQNRFNLYINKYLQARNNPSTFQSQMKTQFGNTFWYYYHFHK